MANCITVTAQIRCVATGEVREQSFECNSDEDGLEGLVFAWSDGNDSCDCNRQRMFDQTDSAFDHECGNCRYVARLIESATGRELYRDGAWE